MAISNASNVSKAWPSHFYNLHEVTVYMISAFGLIGVFGNAIILILYWKLVKLTTTQFLIFVIAIFDFITALIVVPLNIVYYSAWYDINSVYFCRIVYASGPFCIIPGACLLFFVSVVRYVHVCRPHLLPLIEPYIKTVCVITVLIGLAYGVLEAVGVSIDPEVKDCFFTHDRGMVIARTSKYVVSALVIAALVVLNILIIKRNHQMKVIFFAQKEKGKDNKDGEAEPYTGTLDEFFHLVSEHQSPETNDRMNNIKGKRHSKADKSENNNAECLSNNNNIGDQSNQPLATTDHNVNQSDTTENTATGHDVKDGGIPLNKMDDDNKDELSPRDCRKKKRGRTFSQCTEISFQGLSRTTVMISIVSLVYVLCFLSLIIFLDYDYLTAGVSVELNKFFIQPMRHMYFLGCAANPIVYTFVNPSFRSRCRRLLRL